MFNDFSLGSTQHGQHDPSAADAVPKKERKTKDKDGSGEGKGASKEGGKEKAKMTSKDRVRQALNTKADTTTIIIGRNYVTEADAYLPYGTKKAPARVTPKYPDLAAKNTTVRNPSMGIQPGLKAAEQPGAPQSVESMIAQGLHLDKPVQPFYELSPAEQSKIRFNLTVNRILMSCGIAFAAGCCGGVWYYLKVRGGDDDDEDPFEPYADLIEESSTEAVATTTTTTTTDSAAFLCIGEYCFSSVACQQFDGKILTRIAANLSETYAPLITTVDSFTDCLNQTFAGTPFAATDPLCANPGFACNAIQLIPANLLPFLMGLSAKAGDISCGCQLCQWPMNYITSADGVGFCSEQNARAYVEGDPCGSVCGLSWPVTVASNATALVANSTTTSTTSTSTTTIDSTICIGPAYRPTDHQCPMCTPYHSRIVASMANMLLSTSAALVQCVRRTYEGQQALSFLSQGRRCSDQRLCFAFEVMLFEFAREDPAYNLANNQICGCELCKWPRDWLSYGNGRNCLNAANIVAGKWCGGYCNQTWPVLGAGVSTDGWTGLTTTPAPDLDINGTNGTNVTSTSLRLLDEAGHANSRWLETTYLDNVRMLEEEMYGSFSPYGSNQHGGHLGSNWRSQKFAAPCTADMYTNPLAVLSALEEPPVLSGMQDVERTSRLGSTSAVDPETGSASMAASSHGESASQSAGSASATIETGRALGARDGDASSAFRGDGSAQATTLLHRSDEHGQDSLPEGRRRSKHLTKERMTGSSKASSSTSSGSSFGWLTSALSNRFSKLQTGLLGNATTLSFLALPWSLLPSSRTDHDRGTTAQGELGGNEQWGGSRSSSNPHDNSFSGRGKARDVDTPGLAAATTESLTTTSGSMWASLIAADMKTKKSSSAIAPTSQIVKEISGSALSSSVPGASTYSAQDSTSQHSSHSTADVCSAYQPVPPTGFVLDSTSGLFAASLEDGRAGESEAMCHLVAHDLHSWGRPRSSSLDIEKNGGNLEAEVEGTSSTSISSSTAASSTSAKSGTAESSNHLVQPVFTRRVRVERIVDPKEALAAASSSDRIGHAHRTSRDETQSARDQDRTQLSSSPLTSASSIPASGNRAADTTSTSTMSIAGTTTSNAGVDILVDEDRQEELLVDVSNGRWSRSPFSPVPLFGKPPQDRLFQYLFRPRASRKPKQADTGKSITKSLSRTAKASLENGGTSSATTTSTSHQEARERGSTLTNSEESEPAATSSATKRKSDASSSENLTAGLSEVGIEDHDVLAAMDGLWNRGDPRAVFSLHLLVKRVRDIRRRTLLESVGTAEKTTEASNTAAFRFEKPAAKTAEQPVFSEKASSLAVKFKERVSGDASSNAGR
ncbi:unnamed protein product [Amoebophrya sp. A25]|nr:unnamed protein product [Amoebophrya sp. A25]|eukprot:GSA25T00012272001.1